MPDAPPMPDAPVKEPDTAPETRPAPAPPEPRPELDPFNPPWPEKRPEPQPKATKLGNLGLITEASKFSGIVANE